MKKHISASAAKTLKEAKPRPHNTALDIYNLALGLRNMFGSKYLPATPEERKTMQEFRNRYGQRDLNLAIRLAFQLPPRGQEMIARLMDENPEYTTLRAMINSFKPKKEKKGGKADSPRTAELRKIRETRPLTPAESREWRAHFNPVSPETKLKAIEEGKRFILAGLNHLARFECTPDEMQDICAECLGEIEFDLGECVTVDNLTTHSAPNYVPTLEERVAELERRANAVQQILQEHGLA